MIGLSQNLFKDLFQVSGFKLRYTEPETKIT